MCASGRRVVNIEVVVVRTSRGVRAGLMLGTGVEQWCFRSGGARKCMRTSGVERQVGNSCHPRQRRQHSPAVLVGEGGSGVEWSGVGGGGSTTVGGSSQPRWAKQQCADSVDRVQRRAGAACRGSIPLARPISCGQERLLDSRIHHRQEQLKTTPGCRHPASGLAPPC